MHYNFTSDPCLPPGIDCDGQTAIQDVAATSDGGAAFVGYACVRLDTHNVHILLRGAVGRHKVEHGQYPMKLVPALDPINHHPVTEYVAN